MTTNRIITRGLGTSRGLPGRAGLVTQGFGGIPPVIVQALESRVARAKGGSSKIEEVRLITIWAKLIELNNHRPIVSVEGHVTVSVPDNDIKILLERIKTSVNAAWSRIKVTVQRVR